jgi:uncharacterized membrane protein
MTSVALPVEERRVLVQGLWISVALLGALSLALLGLVLGSSGLLLAAVVAGVLSAAISATAPSLAWRAYSAWNRRLAYPVSRLARHIITLICFYVTFTAVGRTGSRLPLAPHRSGTAWAERTTQPADSYRSTFNGRVPAVSGGWMIDYIRWARQTGNTWSITLLPFLAVLRLLPDERESTAPENIYTLF